MRHYYCESNYALMDVGDLWVVLVHTCFDIMPDDTLPKTCRPVITHTPNSHLLFNDVFRTMLGESEFMPDAAVYSWYYDSRRGQSCPWIDPDQTK